MKNLMLTQVIVVYAIFIICSCNSTATNNNLLVKNKTNDSSTIATTKAQPQNSAAKMADTLQFNSKAKLPSQTSLNISFTLNGEPHKFYGVAYQSTEIDGSLHNTEFSINGNIFSQTSYDYGEGDRPDGISLYWYHNAMLNTPMKTDADNDAYLKVNGIEYIIDESIITINYAKDNLISGTFSVVLHTKNNKAVIIKDGVFENVPVQVWE